MKYINEKPECSLFAWLVTQNTQRIKESILNQWNSTSKVLSVKQKKMSVQFWITYIFVTALNNCKILKEFKCGFDVKKQN